MSSLHFKFFHFLNIVCFLLGSTPGSELYMPTFRNTLCFVFIGRWYEE